MTTIAYRDGVMAGDTQCSYGNAYESGAVRKVMRTRDGRLLGMSGSVSKTQSFASALASSKNAITTLAQDDGRVIEVLPSGRIWIHENGGKYCIGSPREGAWGSGSDAARGAMLMGADAVQAVRIASKIDTGTGGRVLAVRLHAS